MRPMPWLALVWTACSPDPIDLPSFRPPPPSDVTWYGEVRDVLGRSCITCHRDGGTGGFALDTYAAAAPLASKLADAVEDGRMPPWLPDASCHTLQGQLVISPEDQEVLRRWADLGAPEGLSDGLPAVPPELDLLEDHDEAVTVPGFVPRLDRDDDTHCFVFDEPGFDHESFVEAVQVVRGSATVHHAHAFALPPAVFAQYRTLDDAAPGVGFPCSADDWAAEYGDDPTLVAPDPYPPAMNSVAPLLGGFALIEYPDGVALPLAIGTKLGLSVHYSGVSAAVEPDFTEVRLRVIDDPPALVAPNRIFESRDLFLPAGDPSVSATLSWPYWGAEPLSFGGAGGHMHRLGASLLLDEVSTDGSTTCWLSIPEWDYDHRDGYQFPEDDRPTLETGSRLRLSCTFDNSAANQPVVDGVRQEPADVTWGEGLEDEMCLSGAAYLTPYRAPIPDGEPACFRVQDCSAACGGTVSEVAACRQACAERDPSCAACFRDATLSCPTCDSEALRGSPCWDDCNAGYELLGGSVGTCLAHQCPSIAEVSARCVEATVDGSCRNADHCGL